jgi:predicted metal-dependent HD superfamily phosphohydrolase
MPLKFVPQAEQAIAFAQHLLLQGLPDTMVFHNYTHTQLVVRGVAEICRHEGIAGAGLEILTLAAWFHDTGFSVTYAEHERQSQHIAERCLRATGYPDGKLQQVLSCIAATQPPQAPRNHRERVICDADLYHVSRPEYFYHLGRLRQEWRMYLGKEYSDQAWWEENIGFLSGHHYWTSYGQNILEPGKQENVRLLAQKMEA